MKVLVLVSIFIYFLSTVAGFKCYKCDDNEYWDNTYPDYPDMSCGQSNKTNKCLSSSKFCLTYEFLDGDDNEIRFEKSCDWFEVCKSVGTREMKHPIINDKVEVTCCEGHLCNSQDLAKNNNLPASHSKLSNQSCLFYYFVSFILSSLFVRF